MKMQNEVRSPHSGVVKEILISEGDMVKPREVIMIVGANDG